MVIALHIWTTLLRDGAVIAHWRFLVDGTRENVGGILAWQRLPAHPRRLGVSGDGGWIDNCRSTAAMVAPPDSYRTNLSASLLFMAGSVHFYYGHFYDLINKPSRSMIVMGAHNLLYWPISFTSTFPDSLSILCFSCLSLSYQLGHFLTTVVRYCWVDMGTFGFWRDGVVALGCEDRCFL